MDTRWGMQYELGMCHKFLPEPGDKLTLVHITSHEQAEEKGQAMRKLWRPGFCLGSSAVPSIFVPYCLPSFLLLDMVSS